MGSETQTGRQDTAVPAIELRGISKAFGPVQANKDISIRVSKGSIHGIIGENGAGKSTLMSILYGFYKADSGDIFINGQKQNITDSEFRKNCRLMRILAGAANQRRDRGLAPTASVSGR